MLRQALLDPSAAQQECYACVRKPQRMRLGAMRQMTRQSSKTEKLLVFKDRRAAALTRVGD